jgi:hypothetical protein
MDHGGHGGGMDKCNMNVRERAPISPHPLLPRRPVPRTAERVCVCVRMHNGNMRMRDIGSTRD